MLLWKTNKNKLIYYLPKKIIYWGKKSDHAGYLLKYEIFNSKQTKQLDNQLSRNPKKSKYKIDASCVKYFFLILHLMI